MKSAFWHFDTWHLATDSDWGEDDSSGIAIQPDHYPSVAGPHKKRKRRKKKHKTDAICPTCKKNNLVNGSCPQCNWGDNPSDPIKNFPLDPVKDDRAGIRAARYVQNEYEVQNDDDWTYEYDPRVGKFFIHYPQTNSGHYVTRDELDQMIFKDKETSLKTEGQMPLWEETKE